MNKICGYTCEHNKGGICQITACDKLVYMTNTTNQISPGQTMGRTSMVNGNVVLDINGLQMQIKVYEEEIDRLNNIINELEKWCNETMKKYKLPLVEQNKGALGFTLPIQDTYQQVLDKLKALKENTK